MSIPQAVAQLAQVEDARREGVLILDQTLAIALSRVGGGPDNERIVAGTLAQLQLLHRALSYGTAVEVVHLLVERGTDINARETNGQTPLHRASSSWEVIRLRLAVPPMV
jgi:diphthine synthase